MPATGLPFFHGDAIEASRVLLDLVPEDDDFAFFRPLFHYWSRLRGDRPAPSRSDIDPVDMPRALLPNLMLIEVELDPLDFRFRLSGTQADTIVNRNLAGVRLLDLPPPAFTRSMHDDLARMADDLLPQFVHVGFKLEGGRVQRNYRALRLPLCDAEGRMEMVLSLVDHGTLPM